MKIYKRTWIDVLIIFLLACLSAASIWYYYHAGKILFYQDASTHLNISRRVFDNLTPGIVQLGGTWLPLLHILQLPFVISDTLWRTGLAGSVVSSLAFVCGGYFFYRFLFLAFNHRLGAITGLFIYATNPNLLYLQTASMFEPLLICMFAISMYFILSWSKKDMVGDLAGLIKAAFAVLLLTLSKYDGWFVVPASAIFVGVFSYTKTKSRAIAESRLILFCAVAGLGIIVWIGISALIFGEPLYFSSGEFSARAQQRILESKGMLPTSKNLFLATAVYLKAVVLNQGVFLTALSILGVVMYLVKNKWVAASYYPFILLAPLVFNIVSLFNGSSVIWVGGLPPYIDTNFNIRYGLIALLFIAYFTSYLATHKSRLVRTALFSVMLFQLYFFVNMSPIVLLDKTGAVDPHVYRGSKWFQEHYSGGKILISAAVLDAFIIDSGSDYKNYIFEGSGRYWRESIIDPSKHAEWIVVTWAKPGDVEKAAKSNPNWFRSYDKLYDDGYYEMYKKRKL